MKLSVVNTFAALVAFSLPDPDEVNVFRTIEYTARFKTFSNEPGARERLQDKQDREGLYAFLSEVLTGVDFKDKSLEFEDENGQPMEPLEWVKRSQFAGAGASLKFWEVVNRDVEAKNSKTSRRR